MGTGTNCGKMKECVWLKPEAVTRIAFLEWTGADNLRHTKFVAMRDDKRPEESRPRDVIQPFHSIFAFYSPILHAWAAKEDRRRGCGLQGKSAAIAKCPFPLLIPAVNPIAHAARPGGRSIFTSRCAMAGIASFWSRILKHPPTVR